MDWPPSASTSSEAGLPFTSVLRGHIIFQGTVVLRLGGSISGHLDEHCYVVHNNIQPGAEA